MTTTDRLDAIEARANAATEGPWVRGIRLVHSPCYVAGPEFRDTDGELDRLILADRIADPDTTNFIAHARTDVPALVAALRGVLAVHAPGWGPVLAGHYCQGCGVGLTDDRPDCPTVAAITDALTEVTA